VRGPPGTAGGTRGATDSGGEGPEPGRHRAAGRWEASIPGFAGSATVSNWSANLLITVTFLSLIGAVGKPWTFWIYAIFAGLAIIFVWRFVPETKGRPLEHIDKYWAEGHRWPESPESKAA